MRNLRTWGIILSIFGILGVISIQGDKEALKIEFSEQHTRRVLRNLFSEEKILREDQKIENGRPIHLYGSKES